MTEQKFTIYAVKDVRPLIKSLNYLSDEEKDDLKLKKFGKKSDEIECYVFSIVPACFVMKAFLFGSFDATAHRLLSGSFVTRLNI